jgi:hypothetical protein
MPSGRRVLEIFPEYEPVLDDRMSSPSMFQIIGLQKLGRKSEKKPQ